VCVYMLVCMYESMHSFEDKIHHWPLPIASEVEAVPFSQAVN